MLRAMTTTERANPAFNALILVGGIAAVAGVVIWVIAARAVAADSLAAEYREAIYGTGGLAGDSPAQFGVWVGIAVLILGVVMLLAALIIRAARSQQA